ncbi:3967_t:CDS:2 [Entrophospora sp. SA101]|nr:3967_t:CDS:2 [Entrophospora sp. SA101]
MKNFPNNFETGINIKKNEEFMMTHQKQNRNNFVTSNTNNYTITNNNNITNSGLINRDKDIFVESLVATIIETIWCNFPVVTTAQIIPLHNKNIDPATCGRRMFLASLIIASKYLQDKNYSNTAWSKICGLQTSSNMDAHSFENPNLSTVLTAPPMIIMSRSKECHVRVLVDKGQAFDKTAHLNKRLTSDRNSTPKYSN